MEIASRVDGPPLEVRTDIMSIIAFILFGIIVGFLARAIMPGRQGMGIVATALLGIGGSFVGGFIGSALSGHSVLELHTSGIIGSIVGSLIILGLMGFAGRHSFA
jgi:uncharacterized membrane protein YeaQ/YmgE (transglycosylase-associated protein family)